MNSRCTVCNHPLIDDINLAVLSGDYSLNQLSDKFGPSRDAFHRHKRHLEKKMRRTLERLDDHRKQVAFLKLGAFLDQVEKRVEAAAAAEDTDRVFKGSHIGSRIIHQLNKMDLPLEPDTAYRLLSAPGLASRNSILPTGPRVIADLHQTLVDQALAPCPPPEADEADGAAEILTADQPDLENELRQLLAGLDSENPCRQTAKPDRQERKKPRRHKPLLNGKTASPNPVSLFPLPCLLSSEAPPGAPRTATTVTPGPESEASAAAPAPSTALETRKSELETSFPQPERDRSATNAQCRRRQLQKKQQYQKYIFKAKKLLKNFTKGWKTTTPPDLKPEPPANAVAGIGRESTRKGGEAQAPLAALQLLPALGTRKSELETSFPKPETSFPEPKTPSPENRKPSTANPLIYDPWTSPDLDPWSSPFPDNAEPPPSRELPQRQHLCQGADILTC